LFCAISVLILLWFVYEISSNTTEITTAEYARQDDLLIEQFQTVSLWKYCKSSVFRNSHDEELRQAVLPLSKRGTKTFLLRTHASTSSRSLVPSPFTQSSQWNGAEAYPYNWNNAMSTCLDHEDPLRHFLVFYSHK
jgi:hypothetical protein